jgi:hypothetical protein
MINDINDAINLAARLYSRDTVFDLRLERRHAMTWVPLG